MIFRVLAKYRRAVVLSSALLLSFLLMTLEVRREEEISRFLERLLLESIAPLLKATAYVKTGAVNLWENYVDLRGVRQENLHLREEVQSLQRRLRTLEEQALENWRLKTLLRLQQQEPSPSLVARVVGKDATNWFRHLVIDQGSHHGLSRHMPVIAPEGLVGQVAEVTPWSARVQLITDPVSSVGVLLQSSRVTGLLVGTERHRLRIKHLPILAEIRSGEVVVTSGMGGVYPKGVLVGKVVEVERRSGALFQEAVVEPSVDFSRLEEVVVIMEGRGS